jgi:hypothetical protein
MRFSYTVVLNLEKFILRPEPRSEDDIGPGPASYGQGRATSPGGYCDTTDAAIMILDVNPNFFSARTILIG